MNTCNFDHPLSLTLTRRPLASKNKLRRSGEGGKTLLYPYTQYEQLSHTSPNLYPEPANPEIWPFDLSSRLATQTLCLDKNLKRKNTNQRLVQAPIILESQVTSTVTYEKAAKRQPAVGSTHAHFSTPVALSLTSST